MDIKKFWKAVLKQAPEEIRPFFKETAYINWHCTNEHFTVDQFIRANCEYPGKWDGTIERIEWIDNLVITAARVFAKDKELSFHVVSFIKIENDKIASLDEYWGDDGIAPQWRLDMQIGTTIN